MPTTALQFTARACAVAAGTFMVLEADHAWTSREEHRKTGSVGNGLSSLAVLGAHKRVRRVHAASTSSSTGATSRITATWSCAGCCFTRQEKVELSLLPDPRLNWGQREKDQPQTIGSLTHYQGRLSGILSMPEDALPALLQMLVGEQMWYVVLTGEKLRYGRGLVRYFQLQMTIDEDDLPAEV